MTSGFVRPIGCTRSSAQLAPNSMAQIRYSAAIQRPDFGRHFDFERTTQLKELLVKAGVGEGDLVVEIGGGRSADIPVLASILGARVKSFDINAANLACARGETGDFLLSGSGNSRVDALFKECYDRIEWIGGKRGHLLRMPDPGPARAVVMEGVIDLYKFDLEKGIMPQYTAQEIDVLLAKAYGFLDDPGTLFVGMFQTSVDREYFSAFIGDFALSKSDVYMYPGYQVLPRSRSTFGGGPDLCQMFVLEKNSKFDTNECAS